LSLKTDFEPSEQFNNELPREYLEQEMKNIMYIGQAVLLATQCLATDLLTPEKVEADINTVE